MGYSIDTKRGARGPTKERRLFCPHASITARNPGFLAKRTQQIHRAAALCFFASKSGAGGGFEVARDDPGTYQSKYVTAMLTVSTIASSRPNPTSTETARI